MTDRQLAEFCARKAIEKKAENVVILDMQGQSTVADYHVVASGLSERQVVAIADFVADSLKADGIRPTSIEGVREGRWALVDMGSVILHVFLDHLRDWYSLETLWAHAPRIRVSEDAPRRAPFGPSANSAHF